jgi:hypothetical protein
VKENRENDIDRAERTILVYSWMGVISAVVVMAYCIGRLL